MEKVTVYSSIANVGIINRDMRFKRMWPKKNSKHDIDKEVLADLMVDPGVESLFKKGYLYIKNTEQAKEMDMEPVGKIYNDAQIKVLLDIKPVAELVEALKEMSKASRENLVELAKNTDLHLDKIEAIRSVLGVDLTSAMQIRRQELLNPSPHVDGE